MTHAEHTVTVRRPVGEVYAFLLDGTNNPRWRPEVTAVRHVSGQGAGARYAQTMTGMGGHSIAGDYRLTLCEPPGRIEFEVTAGPARPTGCFVLREVAPGETEVTFVLDIALHGPLLALRPLITNLARAEVANLENLERALAD
ncbi:hypothetical protein GXW83_11810 [Streptacidiphilus sp. PB12-B1b]|uniref:SRPBCC family protein n=1 Tax=Streptacidiphilus sp. PB12-B1b TaxID=2705012 RepID=UPI0015F8FDD7|nr:SRPBCC family protein [Streptacidiphilus sp. PB12-B1b]QMU76326.1 hypothetical protein GXW83_11810 [Streptacidiphilus sp. PB12-B1b]